MGLRDPARRLRGPLGICFGRTGQTRPVRHRTPPSGRVRRQLLVVGDVADTAQVHDPLLAFVAEEGGAGRRHQRILLVHYSEG